MDGDKIGVTSCETAAKFHYRYSSDLTTTKCYNCNNLFYIRKYPRQKNLWLRFKRFLVQFADGQQLIPFITLLTKNKYLIEGFVIIPVEGGEDRIECRECGEWTTVHDVDRSTNISIGLKTANEIEQQREKEKEKLRTQFEESRTDKDLTLPDGSKLDGRYVVVRLGMLDEPGGIRDILNINIGRRRIVANTLKLSEQEQLHDLLHLKEPRDSKMLQNYSITKKKAFGDSLYQRYPPRYHYFETYNFLFPILCRQTAEKLKRKAKEIWGRIKT